MGCCPLGCGRRPGGFKPGVVVPEPLTATSPTSTGKSPQAFDPGTSDTPAAVEEESIGNSDDDGDIDEESSASDPGLPPEMQWARQGRRQTRQKKRRQRAARAAKRAREEEDLGNSDCDDDVDEESSASDPGLPPEMQWERQARRQARQKKRQQRVARAAKRAAAAGGGNLCEASNPLGFDAVYSIGERVGRGAFAAVSKCTHLCSQAVCARKTIDRRRCAGEQQLREEIEIMRMVDHPNIVRLLDIFEDVKCIHIVMELCEGGELLDKIQALKNQGFDELTGSRATRQIASAIAYLHSIRVAHRDLKPENVMLVSQGFDVCHGTLKLIDFGLSKRFIPGQFMQTMACTVHYVAPEVLDRKYTESSDLWSLGVLIYVMLSGVPPFHGNGDDQILGRVKSGEYDFDRQSWATKGDGPKSLIGQLLKLDTSTRLTGAQVLQHAWLQGPSQTCPKHNFPAPLPPAVPDAPSVPVQCW